ncbi:uncharacterized protein B0I36DRAFT_369865 [Microdochium trichocladiopsis]|uniref:RING-type domain-containing protein n=1 Tax=Microdochium trichocladiopsis TaxID=1682393 RepID=A0A9P9BIX6_9PEZI|nr:uncharacterized protein B0I36DRAFT_369865 [Microdochium trichocladiopsis]KAH7012758.1 hypothetical protein B0I36DRAFT_369865 [Microdochium trichocladiopsis]
MPSRLGDEGHLDATSRGEVFLCRGCDYEWYKDEHGESLTCPMCHGDATEIVDLRNDARPMNHPDQDQADIGDYLGYYARGNIFRGSVRFPPPPVGQQPQRRNPGDGGDIIGSFTELLRDIGGPGGAGASAALSGQQIGGSRRLRYQVFSEPEFTGGINNATARGDNVQEPGSLAGDDAEFQRVFRDIFRGLALDHDGQDDEHMRANAGRHNWLLDMTRALTDLFNNLPSPYSIDGDGAYTDEEFDRLTRNMGELNLLSSASAAAFTETIESLTRKPLDEATLGSEHKGTCTICQDDMKIGAMATFMPCKHWFHEELIRGVCEGTC